MSWKGPSRHPCTRPWRRPSTPSSKRSGRSRGAREPGGRDAPTLAGARPRDSQGLDRPEGSGRQEGRRIVALPPGAARRAGRPPRAPPTTRDVDAELPPGGAVRRRGSASRRARCVGADGCAAAWARTRTPTADCCSEDLQMPDFRQYAVDVPKPGVVVAENTRSLGQLPARRHDAQPEPAQFPGVRSR